MIAWSWELAEFVTRVVWVHWILGTALVGGVAVALRVTQRLNASSRHAVWMIVLLVLVALPGSFLLRDSPLAASPSESRVESQSRQEGGSRPGAREGKACSWKRCPADRVCRLPAQGRCYGES